MPQCEQKASRILTRTFWALNGLANRKYLTSLRALFSFLIANKCCTFCCGFWWPFNRAFSSSIFFNTYHQQTAKEKAQQSLHAQYSHLWPHIRKEFYNTQNLKGQARKKITKKLLINTCINLFWSKLTLHSLIGESQIVLKNASQVFGDEENAFTEKGKFTLNTDITFLTFSSLNFSSMADSSLDFSSSFSSNPCFSSCRVLKCEISGRV